jgi:hypothetical protein
MMCSPLELGAGTEHDRIYILPENLKEFIGEPVKSHFSVK